MNLKITKTTVDGIKTVLMYPAIRYSLAFAVVIAAVFAGLYFIKDSPAIDIFKRDDKGAQAIRQTLNDIMQNQTTMLQKIDTISKSNSRQDELLRAMEKSLIVNTVFNPSVPEYYRARAFRRARELHMNHGIMQQYKEFVNKYPQAIWEDAELPSEKYEREHSQNDNR